MADTDCLTRRNFVDMLILKRLWCCYGYSAYARCWNSPLWHLWLKLKRKSKKIIPSWVGHSFIRAPPDTPLEELTRAYKMFYTTENAIYPQTRSCVCVGGERPSSALLLSYVLLNNGKFQYPSRAQEDIGVFRRLDPSCHQALCLPLVNIHTRTLTFLSFQLQL